MDIPSCCFFECSNSRIKMDSQPGSLQVSFYEFPKNPEDLAKWRIACKLPANWDVDQCVVCSDHFTDSDFQEGHLGSDHSRQLKSDAVPSHREDKENLPPEKIKGEAKKILVESLPMNYEPQKEVKKMINLTGLDVRSNRNGQSKNRPTPMSTRESVTNRRPQMVSIIGTITPTPKIKAGEPERPSSSGADDRSVEITSRPPSGQENLALAPLDSHALLEMCQGLVQENSTMRRSMVLLKKRLVVKEKKYEKKRKELKSQIIKRLKQL